MIHSVSESGVPKLITPRSGNYVKIFPNPVNSSSSIQFFINQPGEVQFELFLIEGRLVARRSGYFSAGEHSLSLEFFNRDLSRLPSGSFILKTKLPGISHPQANLYHLIH